MCYSVSNYNTQLKKLQPQNMRKKLLGGRNRVQHREYAVSAADFSTKYELIFTTLMTLKTQSLGMERLWMEHCSLGQELDTLKDPEIKRSLRPAMDRFNLLRVKIQSFLVTLQNFYFLHVIDKLFDNLISKLHSVDRFDSILKLHEQYMNDLCRFFFISSGDMGIKQCINELLDCSKRFVGLQVLAEF